MRVLGEKDAASLKILTLLDKLDFSKTKSLQIGVETALNV